MSDTPRGWNWIIVQGLLFLLILLTPRLIPFSLSIFLRAPGWLFIGFAAYLGSGALLALGSSLSLFPRPLEDAELVRSGPYRLLRHPIYGALILGTWGWSLWRAHLPGLILALALAAFFDRKSRHEEELLMQRYPDYADFQRSTRRRLIPWIY
ncbi:isoprenylcysteine carboxylmethyltransferase family protein [bacterium]|nr:isoprenylcysteine carboxylmethyltransferase family protein [bacterium]